MTWEEEKRRIRLDAYESFCMGYQQLRDGDISPSGFADGTWQLLQRAIDEAFLVGVKEGARSAPAYITVDNTEQF